ncbi:MAG TPA: cbb3-type cytochrome c oxidase subunit II [Anaerolineae bacterium]|nr:cbb3-type cytochrome c oxidase subunit II [Anaerolineae bacterium]
MAEKRRWLPPYYPTPREWGTHPRKKMLMTPVIVFVGGIFAFAVTTSIAAILQIFVFKPPASNDWAPLTNSALRGRMIFIRNGCSYCHSGFTRPQDVRQGLYFLYPRVSRPGDYFGIENSPNVFGSERTGPDLTFDSGYHPDDWHRAHFFNARYVTPFSIMPQFSFLSDNDVEDLIEFIQTRGNKSGLLRTAGQIVMKEGHRAGGGLPAPPKGFSAANLTMADVTKLKPNPPQGNVDGLPFPHPFMLSIVDRSYWLADDPMPVTTDNLIDGRRIFQERCIGCHGEGGAGVSLAARFLRPPPFDFTDEQAAASGPHMGPGMWYYFILRGIPGTDMENFGTRLTVEEIWKVVLFLKTIPNGGLLPDRVPTPEMYIQWKPPPPLLSYIAAHPLDKNKDFVEKPWPQRDAFELEQERVTPGLSPGDRFFFPGFGEVSKEAIRARIKSKYEELLDAGWKDLETRSGPKPPRSQKEISPPSLRDFR